MPDQVENKPLNANERIVLGDQRWGPCDPIPRRAEVEPYIAALLQVDHLNLLIGSGLSTGLEVKASKEGDPKASLMEQRLVLRRSKLSAAIEEAAKCRAAKSNRAPPNLEDWLSVAITAVEGLKIAGHERTDKLSHAIESALTELRRGVERIEQVIRDPCEEHAGKGMSVQHTLVSFLSAFAMRTPTRSRLHVFTTNYDRVIEWGAELAGLRVLDRFVGSLEPVFRSSRLEIDYHYSPPGAVQDPRYLDGVFRLTKLHGSLDWRFDQKARSVVRLPMPFGTATSNAESPRDRSNEILIYPIAVKDFETTHYPYSELHRDFSAALCRPHSGLVVYGYSFGDAHINRVIKDMLTIPTTHLLVASYDDRGGRIGNFVKESDRRGQISLLIGESIADLDTMVSRWLPSPAADRLHLSQARISRARNSGGPTAVDKDGNAGRATPPDSDRDAESPPMQKRRP